jgi:hypothetical protein
MSDQTRAKHHYVTRAYLENMPAKGETRLWVYQRDSNRVFRNIPENLASIRAFYTVTSKGVENDQFEKLLATEIERPGIPIIRKLSTDAEQLGWQELTAAATLVAMQELRVPFKRQQISIMMKSAGDSRLKSAMARPDFFEESLAQLKREGKIAASVSAEKMRQIFDRGEIDVVPTESGVLWALSLMLKPAIETFVAMKWTVLVAPSEMIVTSDTPVCRSYPKTGGSPAGLMNPDLLICFPISARRVLVLSHNVTKYARFQKLMAAGMKREAERLRDLAPSISYRHISSEQAWNINKLIIERATRWIYSPVERPEMPSLFRGKARNVRVEIEELDSVGTVRMTHRVC